MKELIKKPWKSSDQYNNFVKYQNKEYILLAEAWESYHELVNSSNAAYLEAYEINPDLVNVLVTNFKDIDNEPYSNNSL